jgi:hypothetical protein
MTTSALSLALEAIAEIGPQVVTIVTTTEDLAAYVSGMDWNSARVFIGPKSGEGVIVAPFNDPQARHHAAYCDTCKRYARHDGQTCAGCGEKG